MFSKNGHKKYFWSIGTFADPVVGTQYWGIIWDGGGTELWTGRITSDRDEATDETARKMKEYLKNE